MSQPDGGPAFPQTVLTMRPNRMEEIGHDGMTLRDYFAAAALNGIMQAFGGEDLYSYSENAVHSYAAADAMLKARAGA